MNRELMWWHRTITRTIVLSAWFGSAPLGQEQLGDAESLSGRAHTFEGAVQVAYPEDLDQVERFSGELGVVSPEVSADAIRKRLQAHHLEMAPRPSGVVEPIPEVILGPKRFVAEQGLDAALKQRLESGELPESLVCAIQFKRTLAPAEVADLLDMGVTPYFSAGNRVAVVRIPTDRVKATASLPAVHWLSEYGSRYKIPRLDSTVISNAGADEVLGILIWPLTKRDGGRAAELQAEGAHDIRYDAVSNSYFAVLEVAAIDRLANRDWVKRIELAKQAKPNQSSLAYEPSDSRELCNSPHTWFAYDGSGTKAGINDSGIWAVHPDFAGAIAWEYDQNTGLATAPDIDGHGTHVAGIVAGRGNVLPSARGNGPAANLYILKYNESMLQVGDAFTRFNNENVRFVNNSWGVSIGGNPVFGYDGTAEIVDSYADNQGMTLIFSAGNEGPNPSMIKDPAVAKNCITVGALSYTIDGESGGLGYAAWYSSRGPTADDGRLRPDIVAPGGDSGGDPPNGYEYGVVSCNAIGSDYDTTVPGARWPADANYTRMKGTSMAAPHVTGIAALLYQAYPYAFGADDGLVSRDIKALLVANAIPIHNYGTNPANGFANTDTGYGLVDAYHSLFDDPQEKLTLLWGHGGVIETTANSQSWNFSVTSAAARLAVVMCYEDDAGEVNDTQALKDNLDLTVVASDGTQFSFTRPANVHPTRGEGTVEKIVIANPSQHGVGQWTATITGAEWDDLFNPIESQRYTVVVIACYADPYAPQIAVHVPDSTITVAPNTSFELGATVANINGLTAAGITVELTGDPVFGGDVNTTKFLGNLVSIGSSGTVTFEGLTAPATPGPYDLIVTADGVNRGLVSASRQIEVDVGDSPTGGGQPIVIWTSPAPGGPMVARHANVSASFSEAMNSSTLNASTIQVVGSTSGAHAGSITYDPLSFMVTFNPTVDFSPGETVTVTVSQNLQSQDGQPMASDYAFVFTAIDSTPTPVLVNGTLPDGATWTTGNVYLVTGDVTVPPDRTLTIQAGVVVKFDAVDTGGYGDNRYRNDLIVTGTLNLLGTPSQAIVFTSSRDDTYGGDSNGDGAATTPAAGNWGALKYNNPLNVLHDAVVRYGGVGRTYRGTVYDPQMVWVSGPAEGTLEIRDCTIERAYDKAVYADDASEIVVTGNSIGLSGRGVYLTGTALGSVSYCTFDDCSDAAIRVEGSASATVHFCNLPASNLYGVYNAGNMLADARHNWWGDPSGPSGVGPGSGSAVTALVDYDPWETSPVTGTQAQGDSDVDGDVDLDDFAAFESCFSGPREPYGPSCGVFDWDADGDVDLLDWAGFQDDFTGAL